MFYKYLMCKNNSVDNMLTRDFLHRNISLQKIIQQKDYNVDHQS